MQTHLPDFDRLESLILGDPRFKTLNVQPLFVPEEARTRLLTGQSLKLQFLLEETELECQETMAYTPSPLPKRKLSLLNPSKNK